MGLKNTEIVEAREKELRDCLLSPETEHIDSCFDSEDEEDACEVRQRKRCSASLAAPGSPKLCYDRQITRGFSSLILHHA